MLEDFGIQNTIGEGKLKRTPEGGIRLAMQCRQENSDRTMRDRDQGGDNDGHKDTQSGERLDRNTSGEHGVMIQEFKARHHTAENDCGEGEDDCYADKRVTHRLTIHQN